MEGSDGPAKGQTTSATATPADDPPTPPSAATAVASPDDAPQTAGRSDGGGPEQCIESRVAISVPSDGGGAVTISHRDGDTLAEVFASRATEALRLVEILMAVPEVKHSALCDMARAKVVMGTKDPDGAYIAGKAIADLQWVVRLDQARRLALAASGGPPTQAEAQAASDAIGKRIEIARRSLAMDLADEVAAIESVVRGVRQRDAMKELSARRIAHHLASGKLGALSEARPRWEEGDGTGE